MELMNGKTIAIIAVLLGFFSLSATAAPPPAAEQGPGKATPVVKKNISEKPLRGKWRSVRLNERHVGAIFTFDAEKVYIQNYASVPPEYLYRVGTESTPQELDFINVHTKEISHKGIFFINRDVLVILLGEGDRRPKAFQDKGRLVVLRRNKSPGG